MSIVDQGCVGLGSGLLGLNVGFWVLLWTWFNVLTLDLDLLQFQLLVIKMSKDQCCKKLKL